MNNIHDFHILFFSLILVVCLLVEHRFSVLLVAVLMLNSWSNKMEVSTKEPEMLLHCSVDKQQFNY